MGGSYWWWEEQDMGVWWEEQDMGGWWEEQDISSGRVIQFSNFGQMWRNMWCQITIGLQQIDRVM